MTINLPLFLSSVFELVLLLIVKSFFGFEIAILVALAGILGEISYQRLDKKNGCN